MAESVIQVLYVYSYEHTRKMMEEEMRDQYIRKNGFTGMS